MKKTRTLLLLSIVVNAFFGYQFYKRIDVKKYYDYYIKGTRNFDKSWNPHRAELFQLLPVEKNALVFAGDSHVEHFELTELLSKDFKNRGIAGENIQGLRSRLESVTSNKPRKIFLEIGINDLAYGDSREKVISNYKQLIQEIKQQSPHSEIYVSSLFPTWVHLGGNIDYCNKDINKDVMAINKELANFKNVKFIDCYAAFSRNGELRSDLTIDGIHLNAKGYLLWAAMLKKQI